MSDYKIIGLNTGEVMSYYNEEAWMCSAAEVSTIRLDMAAKYNLKRVKRQMYSCVSQDKTLACFCGGFSQEHQ